MVTINDSILGFINQEKLGLSILEKMSYNSHIKKFQRRFRQESQGYN